MAMVALSLGYPQRANAPGVRLTRWTLGVAVTGVAFTRDARHAGFGLGDGSVRLVPLRRFAGRMMAAAIVHQGAVRWLAADCGPETLLSAGEDGRVVSVDGGGFGAELEDEGDGPAAALAAAAVGRRGGWRAVARGASVALYDSEGRHRHDLAHDGAAVAAVALSTDGARLATGHEGGVTVWTLDGERPEPRGLARPGRQGAAAWCPAGRRVAAIGETGAVVCWDMRAPQRPAPVRCLGRARQLSWAPGGDHLVGAGADSILCWRLGGHGGLNVLPTALAVMAGCRVGAVACHPRHDLAAVAYEDGGVVLADLGAGRDLVIKHAGGGAISALAWSPDGEFLAAGSDAGEAALFDFTALGRTRSLR